MFFNKIFSEIFKSEEDKSIKIIINRIVNVLFAILIFLIIILFAAIFGKEYKDGIIDKGVLVGSISTIIGGYLGFIGTVGGIIGSILILKKQLKNEHDKDYYKEQLDISMMNSLLEYTVSETDKIVKNIANEYCELYSDINYIEFFDEKLKSKVCSNNKLPYCIENMLRENPTIHDEKLIYDIFGNAKGEDIILSSKLHCKSKYEDVCRNIYKIFNEIDDYKLLPNNENWNRYLPSIRNKKILSPQDISGIINWLNLLDRGVIESKKKKIRAIEEIKLSIIDSEHNLKSNEKEAFKQIILIEKEIINYIKDFISYRDLIISLIMDSNKLGGRIILSKFKSSDIYLKLSLENIKSSIESKVS